MEDVETRRVARAVRPLAAAATVAGVVVIVAGLVNLHWWGTGPAHTLRGVLDHVRAEYGDQPPALLRDGVAAVELMVLGVGCLAYTMLIPLILRGQRWARTVALVLALATFLIGLIEVGDDASQPVDLRSYLSVLTGKGAGDVVAQIHSLIYPAWYNWFEDVAQGLQVAVSLAAVLVLIWASVWHPNIFGSRKFAAEATEEWDGALVRIRRRNGDQHPT